MSDRYKIRLTELIRAIQQALPSTANRDLREFVEQYYAKMPLLDLERLEPGNAASIAQSSYAFLQQRTAHQPKLHFAPAAEEGRLTLEVINDDMPFLVDSLTAELKRAGFAVHETIHPILFLKRDKKGELQKVIDVPEDYDVPSGAVAESLIHFELSAMPSGTDEVQITAQLLGVLEMVRLVVADWKLMSRKADEAIKSLNRAAKHFAEEEVSEVKDFLHWLTERNFVFLGYVEYDFFDKQGNEALVTVPGSELGVFKSIDAELKPQGLAGIPAEARHFARLPQLVEITKSNRRSIVHRPVLMDYIGVKRFDATGKVIGETRFLGLFTSTVYYQSADRIPFIRRKIARTLERANYDPVSHNGKSLKAILEFFPRDELFQITEADLFEISMGVMSIEAKPEVRLFLRRDAFERFMSCMVYIPRERFNSYLREQIVQILETHLNGKLSAFYTQLTDSPLARLHIIVSTTPGQVPEVDRDAVEAEIAKITNLWNDALRQELVKRHGVAEGEGRYQTLGDAFPQSYINVYEADDAAHDIEKLHECINNGGLAVRLFRHPKDAEDRFRVKVYTTEKERTLSDTLPIIEHMGAKVIDVVPYLVCPKWAAGEVLIRDFILTPKRESTQSLAQVAPLFEDALLRVWRGEVADDTFNALSLLAGLTARQILILRAYALYMKQTVAPYGPFAVASALQAHATITPLLVKAFETRFDPSVKSHDIEPLKAELLAYLDGISNLTEDRIIRHYWALIEASLRTNYYQLGADGAPKPYLSIKFLSTAVPELPLPRPYAEIFVTSMRAEGIHLRGARVARGGLRWSDRADDFRTEILGLMKAQMVKNAVIVPQGSKGGFIVKRPPAGNDRDALQQEAIACYREFLSGLLDLTDNLVNREVVPHASVVRHDGDDPYLVVAADKGTASFSDIANGVSADYGFWLGDAFASGGSAGYDHKEMGITARGAWISVERHFREMGVDINAQDFTVVGIGDMSGDVFGNGMLLSKHIRLVAAFNHRHIFIDPAPDAAKSFDERARLFALPRSGWNDYDNGLISKGGGVFERSAKSIPLSAEIRALLGVTQTHAAPDELIKLLLLAEVDLLWNGGIGTYVKAAGESHDQVGDRGNNSLRVNGEDLRCKTVGEGGNLGFTQRGRIEYARKGGRINTDAIDNSAGVDCSDHEVNIKIALGNAIGQGSLQTADRNALLEQMTEEVAHLVLRDNQLQTAALSLAEHRGTALLDAMMRLMRQLEQSKGEGRTPLDRAVEYLPADKSLQELRAQKLGLTRPELAVLLAYTKMDISRLLLAAPLLEDGYLKRDLIAYFPETMQQSQQSAILAHPLRREIIATMLTNQLVNRLGIAYAHELARESGYPLADIVAAFVVMRDLFGLETLWAEIEACEATLPAVTVIDLFERVANFTEQGTLWLLQHCTHPLEPGTLLNTYGASVAEFGAGYLSILPGTISKARDNLIAQLMGTQVPAALTEKIAGLEAHTAVFDIARIAREESISVIEAGKYYFELGAHLRLGWLRRSATHMLAEGYWDRLAVKSIIQELRSSQRALAQSLLHRPGNDVDSRFAAWQEQSPVELARYTGFIDELKLQQTVTFPMLVVALRYLEALEK